MLGKRAIRHFSQLSEFETSGLIFGMKAAGWSTRRVDGSFLSVPLQIVGSSGHEKIPTFRKTVSGATRKTTILDSTIGSKDLAASNFGH
ncbi:hypothetical protein TNCV_4860721 [Trichonephila clavipes]|nr:hypothetical protein TNCV_4860721 [Trichonephila clavipes]